MAKPSKSGKQSQVSSAKKVGKALTMADLLESTGYKIPALKRGQEVTGKVISKDRSEIIIDIGAKSEGIVFGREFDAVRELAAKLSAGDSVEATVVYPENDAGQVVLSLRKHSGDKLWKELEEKIESAEAITGTAIPKKPPPQFFFLFFSQMGIQTIQILNLSPDLVEAPTIITSFFGYLGFLAIGKFL